MADNSENMIGTGGSLPVSRCQVCGSERLEPVLFLGYMPPVNQMRDIGERLPEQPAYPAELLFCHDCELVQIGLIVDPRILFPPEYPYTSGTTRILHRNFAELAEECAALLPLDADDLVVDIGSNDGTLLSKFAAGGYRVHGIDPTDAGIIAIDAGIPTEIAFFTRDVALAVRKKVGPARVAAACNCFAHIEDIHGIVEGVLELIDDDGVFVTESHYLVSLLDTVQYDTIYHEHLRYYSLKSLSYLLNTHGLEVFHAKRIPTHGGSIRVYAAPRGRRAVQRSVAEIMALEDSRGPMLDQLRTFRNHVTSSKLKLYALLNLIESENGRVYGISAPSRASTLVNYVGLDERLVNYVMEVEGSRKIGKYLPGTRIPVVEESKLFADQPEYALVLAWHIADELAPKLRELGYRGKFIVPLPDPRII